VDAQGAVAMVVVALICGAAGGDAPRKVALTADFEQDPARTGWVAEEKAGEAGPPDWKEGEAHSGSHCLAASSGHWASPLFAVKPGQYYRMQAWSRAEDNGLWHAWFYRLKQGAPEQNPPVITGTCTQLERSEGWQEHTTCFVVPDGITHCRAVFQPLGGKMLMVDDVSVRPVDRKSVGEWADELYATMPPLKYEAPAGRWKHLPQTKKRLEEGGRLRVVMLGDSNVNDIYSSCYDVLVERAFPKATLDVVPSVLGSKGCWYYKEKGRVKKYVLDYRPDLVIIGGISNRDDIESIRSVVRQVRAASGAEIILMSGAAPLMNPATGKPWPLAIDPDGTDYRSRLMKLAAEEHVAFLDILGPFSQYMVTCGKDPQWFHRDKHHFNDRGKQIFARILARYFR